MTTPSSCGTWRPASRRTSGRAATNYESLYAQAISDPELRRTRLELEAALTNADEARKVVFELFQDLDRFSLDEFQPLANVTEGMAKMVRFMSAAVEQDGQRWEQRGPTTFAVLRPEGTEPVCLFTTERDQSLQVEGLGLLGLDHPLVETYLSRFRQLPPQELGVRVESPDGRSGVAAIRHVVTQGERGELRTAVLPLALAGDGDHRVITAKANGPDLSCGTSFPRLPAVGRGELGCTGQGVISPRHWLQPSASHGLLSTRPRAGCRSCG